MSCSVFWFDFYKSFGCFDYIAAWICYELRDRTSTFSSPFYLEVSRSWDARHRITLYGQESMFISQNIIKLALFHISFCTDSVAEFQFRRDVRSSLFGSLPAIHQSDYAVLSYFSAVPWRLLIFACLGVSWILNIQYFQAFIWFFLSDWFYRLDQL